MSSITRSESAAEDRGASLRIKRTQSILDVALRLFSTKGFEDTTVTEIERGAGLAPGKGGFYRHFPSKDAVFRAVIEREIERAALSHLERLNSVRASLSVREHMMAEVRHSLDAFEKQESLTSILNRDADRVGPLLENVLRVMVNEWIQLHATAINLAATKGESKHADAKALGTIIVAAVTGFQLMRRFFAFGGDIAGIDQDRFARALTDLVYPKKAEGDEALAGEMNPNARVSRNQG